MVDQNAEALSGVHFSVRDGIELIEVENAFAKAVVTTHGACVLSFTPKGQQDLLWVSDQSVYDGSKPVRGGIPVCWPWFGQAVRNGYPAHGFVRNQKWQVEKVSQLSGGQTRISLIVSANEASKQYWPDDFKLQLCIEVGSQLTLSLTTFNESNDPVTITEAFHTYFNIGNPQTLVISGLDGSTHSDKLDDNALPENQEGDVKLLPPRDSVYLQQQGDIVIHDTENSRRIRIKSRNACSAVVWNPGPEIVKGFADIDDAAWKEFACVESGNVIDDFVTIPAGAKHTVSVQYSIESL